MITPVQLQYLQEYLQVLSCHVKMNWGLYKACPKEIMFEANKLTWIEFLLEEEIPSREHHKVAIVNYLDSIKLDVKEHIFADYKEMWDPNDPYTGKIILPKGTKVFNVKIQFPTIPFGETKDTINRLMNNIEVYKWLVKELNNSTNNNYELSLQYLSSKSALVMSGLYNKFRADN